MKDRKEYFKNYYLNNLNIIKEQHKNYRDNNKLKISDRMKKYRQSLEFKQRLSTQRQSFSGKFAINLRNRIKLAIKQNWKSGHTIELLGCSIDFLKKHLESQFTDGMTWNNYGRGDNGRQEWNIDHIKPCCSFNFRNPEEQHKCFHYLNLQPLWAKDNKSKASFDKLLKLRNY